MKMHLALVVEGLKTRGSPFSRHKVCPVFDTAPWATLQVVSFGVPHSRTFADGGMKAIEKAEPFSLAPGTPKAGPGRVVVLQGSLSDPQLPKAISLLGPTTRRRSKARVRIGTRAPVLSFVSHRQNQGPACP